MRRANHVSQAVFAALDKKAFLYSHLVTFIGFVSLRLPT